LNRNNLLSKPLPKPLNMLVTICIRMVTNPETTVKVSRWLIDEIEKFIDRSLKNKSDFPSKRNFIDRAVIKLLEQEGVNLEKK